MSDKKKTGADGQEKEVMVSEGVDLVVGARAETPDASGENGKWFLNFNGEVELFGVKLVGIMEKSDNGLKILIIPKTEEVQKINLADLAEDLADKFDCNIKTEELEAHIKKVGSFLSLNLDALYLRQVFFYYDSAKSAKEFAVSLEIRGAKVEDKTSKLFAINRIAFSIWNTSRPKIIEKMQLITVDGYLEEATAP